MPAVTPEQIKADRDRQAAAAQAYIDQYNKKQQLANELNQLQKSGASESQITAAIIKAGYKDDEFMYNIQGQLAPNMDDPATARLRGRDYFTMSAAEAAENEKYWDSVTQSAGAINQSQIGQFVGSKSTVTQAEVQSTGGGTVTIRNAQPQDTTVSLQYQAQADRASILQNAYQLNPNNALGKRILDRNLADGKISQEQYNEIVNSTPEQRIAKSQEYAQQYRDARDAVVRNQIQPPDQVEVTAPENTSRTTIVAATGKSEVQTTTLNGAITEAGVTAVNIDGVDFQKAGDTYTVASANNVSVAQSLSVNESSIQTGRSQQAADEFGDLEAAVEANSGLQEPPLLDQDELEAELGRAAADSRVSYGTEPARINDELTVPPGTDTEEEGRQPGLLEPLEAGVMEARNSGARNSAQGANQQPPTPLGGTNPVDWRFKIKLAPQANVLYQSPGGAGLLTPLARTGGVIFPYTPTISINYNANYETTEPAHTNYKVFNYRNSSVDSITITGDFTAQDTNEANYLLAVIHFFRSATKMFYGKDESPRLGLPPPLCYVEGHGQFLFSNHPVVIQNFNVNYPNDVDYITATLDQTGNESAGGTLNLPVYSSPAVGMPTTWQRLFQSNLARGGRPAPRAASNFAQATVTRVPTKMQITIVVLPMVTRADYSNRFSLQDYASGKLLAKGQGGFW